MAAAPPMVLRQQVFAFKSEVTTGTQESLANADGTNIIFGDEQMIEQDQEFQKRQGQGTASYHEGIVGAQIASLKFSSELVGSGTGSTAAGVQTLLLAAGLAATVGGSSIAYAPITGSSSLVTLTAAQYIDGMSYPSRGAVLDFILKGEAGKQGMFDWTGKGAWVEPTTASLLTPTYVTSPIPPRIVSATFTVGGSAQISRSFEFGLKNTIAVRRNQGSLVGVHSCVVTDRDPYLQFDVEASTAKNWWSDYTAGATAAGSIVIGSVAGNTWTLAVPKLQLQERPQKINIDGVLGYRLNFQMVRNSAAGDDEFTLTQS